MAKYVISEERLNAIIRESIEEALQDEGLGTKIAQGLGKARQWVQNKVDNYTNAFNAGRNQQRFANKDYDPYQGMEGAENYRNFGGDEYGQYRYNVTADRNNRAGQSWNNQYGTQTNKRPSAGGERAENYTNGRRQGNAQQGNEPQGNAPQANPALNQQPATQQAPQQQATAQQQGAKRGFQPKQARPVADIQKQVTNGRVMSKADGQLVAAALGEYKKNHPEINEGTIKEAVANALKKYINESKRLVKEGPEVPNEKQRYDVFIGDKLIYKNLSDEEVDNVWTDVCDKADQMGEEPYWVDNLRYAK